MFIVLLSPFRECADGNIILKKPCNKQGFEYIADVSLFKLHVNKYNIAFTVFIIPPNSRFVNSYAEFLLSFGEHTVSLFLPLFFEI